MPWAKRSAWRSGHFIPRQWDTGDNEIESCVGHGAFMDFLKTETPVDLFPLHGIEFGLSFHSLIKICWPNNLGLNVSVIISSLSTSLFVNSECGNVSKTSLPIVLFGSELFYVVKLFSIIIRGTCWISHKKQVCFIDSHVFLRQLDHVKRNEQKIWWNCATDRQPTGGFAAGIREPGTTDDSTHYTTYCPQTENNLLQNCRGFQTFCNRNVCRINFTKCYKWLWIREMLSKIQFWIFTVPVS